MRKQNRIVAIAEFLATEVCPNKTTQVARAAWLCKADLVTQMVYEFPEMQGIIGGYYSEYSGEDLEVSLAIKEHYRPTFSRRPPSIQSYWSHCRDCGIN